MVYISSYEAEIEELEDAISAGYRALRGLNSAVSEAGNLERRAGILSSTVGKVVGGSAQAVDRKATATLSAAAHSMERVRESVSAAVSDVEFDIAHLKAEVSHLRELERQEREDYYESLRAQEDDW